MGTTNNKGSYLKYELATNFDVNLIHQVSEYNNHISWFYGKMSNDIVGGGRSSLVIPKFSWEFFKDYVKKCHENNIKFNYLLNAICLGNKEFTKSYHKKVIKLLKRLSDCKVDGVTVSSAYLCDLIKKQFPHFKVTISIHNRIRTLQQIAYWTDMGADELTLWHTVNRDFPLLKKFLEFTKNLNVELRLIGNNACLHECHMQPNHANTQAHASRSKLFSNKINIDYYILNCNNMKVKDPFRILASEWIRPEDVKHYENLSKEVGNSNLSIKLTDRTRTTDFLMRVAKAYVNQSYDGNLLDIINYVGNRDFLPIKKTPFFLAVLSREFSKSDLTHFRKAAFPPLLYVDNKKLDGFINKFIDNYECDKKICQNSHIINENNSDKICGYCKSWEKKVISYNKDEREEWLKTSDSFINKLRGSKIFIK